MEITRHYCDWCGMELPESPEPVKREITLTIVDRRFDLADEDGTVWKEELCSECVDIVLLRRLEIQRKAGMPGKLEV